MKTILEMLASIGVGLLFIFLWLFLEAPPAVIGGTILGMITIWFILLSKDIEELKLNLNKFAKGRKEVKRK